MWTLASPNMSTKQGHSVHEEGDAACVSRGPSCLWLPWPESPPYTYVSPMLLSLPWRFGRGTCVGLCTAKHRFTVNVEASPSELQLLPCPSHRRRRWQGGGLGQGCSPLCDSVPCLRDGDTACPCHRMTKRTKRKTSTETQHRAVTLILLLNLALERGHEESQEE